MSLLSVRNLSVSFHASAQDIEAVKGISFDIPKGKTVALVGESGSGKSVSAHSILKLLPYPKAYHPTGEILFEGHNLLEKDDRFLRSIRGNKISFIFQEPMTSLNPLHTVEKQIGEVLSLHKGMRDAQARLRIIELLQLVGLDDAESRLGYYPHQLSGGQRQRVMIAMALACEPDLLIADEPTTALDVTVQAQILELLQSLQKKVGMAMLLITHDLGIVRKMAHHVVVMKNGTVQEEGKTREIFENPQSDYTRHLIHSAPKGHAASFPTDAPVVLSAADVNVAFPIHKGFFRKKVGEVVAADNISLSLQKGETLGIVGESGSGKTTLAMALLRLQSSTGHITLEGQRIDGLQGKKLRPLRQQMQVAFQDPFGSLSPRMSVAQIVGEGLEVYARNMSDKDRDEAVIQALTDVGLNAQDRHRYPHEFSGGQRQRIAIARALVLKPKIIVLDEPTSALDRSVQSEVVDLLRKIQKTYGLSYVFISHDLSVVRAMSHRVMVMKKGQVVEAGPTEKIFESPEQDYTKALIKAAFDLEAA